MASLYITYPEGMTISGLFGMVEAPLEISLEEDAMDPVVVPIDGTLDLHTFNPKELPALIDDYLQACRQAGIDSVRIIHGKGKGILKKRVHALLARHPLVRRYRNAPEESGGWGATLVELK